MNDRVVVVFLPILAQSEATRVGLRLTRPLPVPGPAATLEPSQKPVAVSNTSFVVVSKTYRYEGWKSKREKSVTFLSSREIDWEKK